MSINDQDRFRCMERGSRALKISSQDAKAYAGTMNHRHIDSSKQLSPGVQALQAAGKVDEQLKTIQPHIGSRRQLRGWRADSAQMHALVPARRGVTLATRLFLKFSVARLAAALRG
jgi:hypothetical protein